MMISTARENLGIHTTLKISVGVLGMSILYFNFAVQDCFGELI